MYNNTATVISLSTSADTHNYVYNQVYVSGAGPYNVRFNNTDLTLYGPIVLNYIVSSIQTPSSNVYLLGFKKQCYNNYQTSNDNYYNRDGNC